MKVPTKTQNAELRTQNAGPFEWRNTIMSKEIKKKEKVFHCACAPGDISGNALKMAEAEKVSSTVPSDKNEPNATIPEESKPAKSGKPSRKG
jgi:hypothetical protein